MESENKYIETDLGNVAPNPRGEYDPAAAYEYLDLVEYGGGSYLCVQETGTVTGIAPAKNKNTEAWQVLTIPGDLTPEYVAMHDDVVNKAESAKADAASTAADREQVGAMLANVEQLHTQTETAAQEASDSRDSAAGYAAAAEASRTAAADSEKNAQLQVTGFDETVNTAKQEAAEEIATARKTAVQAVAAQQVKSVNAVNAAGSAAIEKTSADAKEAKDAKEAAVSAANATEGSAREATAAAEQAKNDKQSAETAATAAKSSAAAAETAQKAVEGATGQIETNKTDITALKEDLVEIDLGTIVKGEYVNKYTGVFSQENITNERTGYVPITDGSLKLIVKAKFESTYNAFYDINKKFVESFTFNASEKDIRIPVNAKFFAISVDSNHLSKKELQVFENTKMKNRVEIIEKNNDIIKCDIDIVRKKQNDSLRVDLKNGLDENTKKVGVYFSEINGEELQNVDFVILEKYMEVEPNTTYTMWSDVGSTGTMKLCNDRIRFVLYDSNKEFEQGFVGIASVKTSENTRYIRVSMPSDFCGRTIFKKGTEQPICEYIPFTEHRYLSDELTNNTIKAIVRPEIFRDKFGKYLPLTCFCQNYSIEDGFSAPIYALSVRDYSDNCQILFKSMDGGITWERKGSVPINITNGEIISNIYVEPLQETLYVIKNLGTAGEENNKLISYDISSNSFSVIGELDIGKKYAHAYSHNFESAFLLNTKNPYTIFAEYGSGNDVEMYVWRTDDRGKTWKKVFTQGSRGGNGEIKHFHCIQYDPYRKELWLASGDTDAEAKIWISADDGLNWKLKYSGSQKTRTLGFVFEKDAIYYGMDSPQPEEPSHLYRINRDKVSGAALDDIQSVGISKNGWAIYNITKMIIPSGILIFSVYERANNSIPNDQYCIEFYDYSKKRIITVGTFDISKETGGYVGVMYAPRHQDMISGKVFFSSIMNLFGICSEPHKSVYSPTYSLTLTV